MILIKLLLTALAAYVAAKLTPGVNITSYWTAIVLALVLALLDVLVKPLLQILSFPITVVTFGLFLLVINAVIILLASWIVSTFQVSGFWTAMLYSIIFSVVSWLLAVIIGF